MFAHATVRSDHTINGSTLPPAVIPAVAAKLGMPAVGLADAGSLAGAPEFVAACRREGVKPLVGETLWWRADADPVMCAEDLCADQAGERLAGWRRRPGWQVTLIAATREGWGSLMRLRNQAAEESRDGPPVVTRALMGSAGPGLVCLTGGLTGPVAGPLAAGRTDTAGRNLGALTDVFGPGRVFVEAQWHRIPAERAVMRELSVLASAHGARLLATNDCRHADPGGRPLLDMAAAVAARKPLHGPDTWRLPGDGWHMRSETEMRALFPGSRAWQDAVDAAEGLVAMVEPDVLPPARPRRPPVTAPDGHGDPSQWLKDRVVRGVADVWRDDPDGLRRAAARAAHEWQVIRDTGFTEYMLFVADLVQWAKHEGIMVGAGRGSSVASVAARALGVTDVDPVAADLLFERFLSVSDPGAPDIDVDVQQSRVGDVTRRLAEMAGPGRAARLGLTRRSQEKECVSAAAVLADPAAQKEWVGKRAGAPAGWQAHGCGWVVSDLPLAGEVPLRWDSRAGVMVTEWEGPVMEALGFPKIDVLSSQALEVDAAMRPVTGTADEAALTEAGLAQMRDGALAGVFQLGSRVAAGIARGVAPRSMRDAAAVVALGRPGPLAAHQDTAFIDRASGAAPDVCPWTGDEAETEALAPVVARTRWCVLYQEQVMRLAEVVAGFDEAERAVLRHALSGKDAGRVRRIGEEFQRRGTAGPDGGGGAMVFRRSTVEGVWRAVEHAGSYMFAEAHAWAYATEAVRQAGMRRLWPDVFGAAVLAATPRDDADRRAAVLRALAADGVPVRGPDVDASAESTVAADGVVRVGLAEVSGVGKQAAVIVGNRPDGGYAGLGDAVRRCPGVPADAWRALVDAGAFDRFGPRMGQMMCVAAPGVAPPEAEWGACERYARQVRVLRHSVDGSPLVAGRGAVGEWVTGLGRPVVGVRAVSSSGEGAAVSVVGVLSRWEVAEGRRGEFARFTVDGAVDVVDGVAWTEALRRIEAAGAPPVGSVVVVDGRARHRGRGDGGRVEIVASGLTAMPLPAGEVPPAEGPAAPWASALETEPSAPVSAARPTPVLETEPSAPETVSIAPSGAVVRLGAGAGCAVIPGCPAHLLSWLAARPSMAVRTPDSRVWTYGDGRRWRWSPFPVEESRGFALPGWLEVGAP